MPSRRTLAAAFQPSIAPEGAGLLAPLAPAVLVAVTLCCALPVYRDVAGETPDGVGSVGMIERLCTGWLGKLAVLVLIGFAATDFVITKTLSAADAAAHLVANPLDAGHTPASMQSQLGVTMFLLVLLGALFMKGFAEVVGVATALVVTLGFRASVTAQGGAYATGVLVPHRPDHRTPAEKEREIRPKHRIEQRVRLVFLEVHQGDVSRFENEPVLSVAEEEGRFVIAARDGVSVSHTIAQVALELAAGGRSLDVVFGFSKGSPLRLAVDFVLFGSGDIPARAVDLFERAVSDPAARPTVIVAS